MARFTTRPALKRVNLIKNLTCFIARLADLIQYLMCTHAYMFDAQHTQTHTQLELTFLGCDCNRWMCHVCCLLSCNNKKLQLENHS